MKLLTKSKKKFYRKQHNVAWRELECTLHYLCCRDQLIRDKYKHEVEYTEYMMYALFGIRYYISHQFAINLDHFLGATPTQDSVEKYTLEDINMCLTRIYIFFVACQKGEVKETLKQAVEEGIIEEHVLKEAGGIVKAEKYIKQLFKV